MKPQLNDVNTFFIVLEKLAPVKTKEHMINNFLVADESAAINLTVWDEKADGISSGDILKLSGGHVGIWKTNLSLYTGKKGTLERVGEFNMIFNEAKNMSLAEYEEDPPGSKRYVPRPRSSVPHHP
ncbi:SOSS complex subunit B [Acrasis kona]|uniref:SOSS complex subunit B n=1 Tax=Acrasis kona TaxID=1008807 RepID=A0AAW2Z8Z9_9EUKA